MSNSIGLYYGYPVATAWKAELYHHGILGMHWGVRRTPEQLGHKVASTVRKAKDDEAAYRKKLSNITKKRKYTKYSMVHPGSKRDVERFEYRNQSLARRVGGTAARVTAQMLIGDMLTGKISNYGSMSKGELAKKLGSIAKTTAANVVIQDALAKSASKRYTDKGTVAKGVNKNAYHKEDYIEFGIKTAVRAAPFLNAALHIKAAQAYAERERNEADFNRWAGNILSEKVDHIIWTSDDGKTQVIE